MAGGAEWEGSTGEQADGLDICGRSVSSSMRIETSPLPKLHNDSQYMVEVRVPKPLVDGWRS